MARLVLLLFKREWDGEKIPATRLIGFFSPPILFFSFAEKEGARKGKKRIEKKKRVTMHDAAVVRTCKAWGMSLSPSFV
jgi:hypothetical protein